MKKQTTVQDEKEIRKGRQKGELKGLACIAAGIFLLAAYGGLPTGFIGEFLREALRWGFGLGAFLFPFVFIAMGILILADALFKIRIAMDARRFGIGAWWLILILAFLTAVAGLLLVFRPWESANTLTVLLGISLLSEAILNLCVAVSTVKIVKHQYPDVIDADFIPVDMEDSNE